MNVHLRARRLVCAALVGAHNLLAAADGLVLGAVAGAQCPLTEITRDFDSIEPQLQRLIVGVLGQRRLQSALCESGRVDGWENR